MNFQNIKFFRPKIKFSKIQSEQKRAKNLNFLNSRNCEQKT